MNSKEKQRRLELGYIFFLHHTHTPVYQYGLDGLVSFHTAALLKSCNYGHYVQCISSRVDS